MSCRYPTPKLKTPLWAWLILAFIVVNSGCEGGLPFRLSARTAEDAIIKDFQVNVRRQKMAVDWNTVEIVQQREIEEGVVFALLSFQKHKENGQQQRCQYYYGAKQAGDRWSVQGSGGGCLPAGQLPVDGSPISTGYGGGWSRDPSGLTFSLVSGVVYDDSIKQVLITWDDGVQQPANIENHSYMAVRLEVRQMSKIEAMDRDGNTLYSRPQD